MKLSRRTPCISEWHEYSLEVLSLWMDEMDFGLEFGFGYRIVPYRIALELDDWIWIWIWIEGTVIEI